MKTLPPKRGGRMLTPDEKKLWKLVTQHDRKLSAEEKEAEAPPSPMPGRKKTAPVAHEIPLHSTPLRFAYWRPSYPIENLPVVFYS